MTQHDLHRHLTPAVGEAQQMAYGQKTYAVPDAPEPDRLGARERAFIGARDSFYLASVTETGAPYIQHRGGPVSDPGGGLRLELPAVHHPSVHGGGSRDHGAAAAVTHHRTGAGAGLEG